MLEPVASSAEPMMPPPLPYGGALTFADAQDFATMAEDDARVDYEIGTFEILLGNIRASTALTAVEKIDFIAALVKELQGEVAAGEVGDPGSMMVFKDNSGSYRWVAVHSNRFEDRTKETFSESSHKAWVDRVWALKEFPALRLWHLPMDIGRADWVDYDDQGFVLSSGKFNPGMEDVAHRLSGMKGLGCSHGYLYRAEDLRNGVYTAYRSYEVSVLPGRRVANDLTAFFAGEEIPMLTPERRQFLVDVMGEDRAKSMEEGVRSLAALAEERGLSYKSLEDALLDDVAREAAEIAGARAFPPKPAAANPADNASSGNDTNAQQQKCPDCGAMVPAADMAQHMQDVHGQTPADANTAAPEAVATAPAAAAQGQQGVTLPNPATSPPLAAAAPATPALTPGALLEGVGEILKGVGTMLDGGSGGNVTDATDPGAAQAAAFAAANKDDTEGEPEAAAEHVDGEPEPGPEAQPEPMAASEKAVVPDALDTDPMFIAFKSAMQPLATQMASMQEEINGLKASRDADIADAIRPRVGLDGRYATAGSGADGNVVTDVAEIARVKAASGGQKDDNLPATVRAANPYIDDLTNQMRHGVGVTAGAETH